MVMLSALKRFEITDDNWRREKLFDLGVVLLDSDYPPVNYLFYKSDAKGFVRLGKWKVYVEEGLPRTPVQVLFWDGKLRAEYREKVLSEYDGKWSDERRGVINLKPGIHYETEFSSKQRELFDPEWLRDPVENSSQQRSVKSAIEQEYYQPKLNFGEAA